MNKKFVYGIATNIKVFLLCLIVVAFCVGLSFLPASPKSLLQKKVLDVIMLIIFAPMAMCGFFVNISTYYIADKEGLHGYSIIYKKGQHIKWSEVDVIGERPKVGMWKVWNLLFYSVTVFTPSSRIIITSGIKNYKELLQVVIDNCKENPNLIITPHILEVIG